MIQTSQQALVSERTEDVKNRKGVMFEDMGLKTELLVGIRSKKYYIPSPIQEEVIPIILEGHDVLARSKNGTGKTASFLIPIIEKSNPAIKGIQAIIIVPTRELAIQTCTICTDLAQFTRVRPYTIIGGSMIARDLDNVKKGIQIIIITPGRLMDILTKNSINLSSVKIICIDEADVVIRPEDNELIDKLIRRIKHQPQLLLFSATFPITVAKFRDTYMQNCIEVNTMNEFTLSGVTQFYACTEEQEKVPCIYTLLTKLKINQCIIFCNTVLRVQLLNKKLNESKIKSKCIHSKMPQRDRLEIFEQFRRAEFRILICSDVFNRGIDIQAVNVVINFDIPSKSATYLHRIGRSGRFGHIGLGITFVASHDREVFHQICAELSTVISPVPNNVEINENLYVSNIPTH